MASELLLLIKSIRSTRLHIDEYTKTCKKQQKLEDFTIDDIIQRLRQTITDDIKKLEDHVTYLHVKCFLFCSIFFRLFYFSKNWKKKQIIVQKQEVFYENQLLEVII